MTTNTDRATIAVIISLILLVIFAGPLSIFEVYVLIWQGIVHTFTTAWSWVIGLAELLGF